MNKPAITVVIPVFNSELYIEKCIESVINQTFTSIEIIVVNDGSEDNSLNIINDFSNKDDRIKVIDQSNLGAGAARNAGLHRAKGKYISFLDSDDFFEKTMLEKAYNKAEKYSADMVSFGSDQFYTDTKTYNHVDWVVRSNEFPPYEPFSYRQITCNVFKAFVGWAWDKLFLRSVILENNLKFQEQRTSNDLLFVFSFIVTAKKICFIDEILAHQRRDSIGSVSKSRENTWYCFYDALIELKKFLVENHIYIELERDFINYALHFSLWNYNTLKEPSKSKLKNMLKRDWLRELDILGRDKSFFYNHKEYESLKRLIY